MGIAPPAQLPTWSLWMMCIASVIGAWLLAWQIYRRA